MLSVVLAWTCRTTILNLAEGHFFYRSEHIPKNGQVSVEQVPTTKFPKLKPIHPTSTIDLGRSAMRTWRPSML